MTSRPHPIEHDELMAYVDGELSPERTAQVAAHLQQCGACASAVDDMRDLSLDMQDWQVEEPSSRIDAVVLGELRKRDEAERGRWYKPSWRWRAVVAMSFGTACSVFIAALLIPSAGQPPSTAASLHPVAVRRSENPTRAVDVSRSPDVARSRASGADAARPAPPLEPSVRNSIDVGGGTFVGQQGQGMAMFVYRQQPDRNEPGSMSVRLVRFSLSTTRFEEVPAVLTELVGGAAGRIESMSLGENSAPPRALSATLHLPAAAAGPLLTELKKLGTVIDEAHQSVDITADYLTVVARVATAREELLRLAVLNARATAGDDVEELRQQIAKKREEIDRALAERTELDRRLLDVSVQLDITEE